MQIINTCWKTTHFTHVERELLITKVYIHIYIYIYIWADWFIPNTWMLHCSKTQGVKTKQKKSTIRHSKNQGSTVGCWDSNWATKWGHETSSNASSDQSQNESGLCLNPASNRVARLSASFWGRREFQGKCKQNQNKFKAHCNSSCSIKQCYMEQDTACSQTGNSEDVPNELLT